ncbi:MAG: Maf family nucleotide pyrophosphatase [Flammeovirgaceae bacterium]|nr:Maf family nucleotide pyrophosphatase [Flammeovirgaceae bacterium]
MLKTKYKIILGSNSPRRKQLLSDLGIEFEVKVKPTPEDFPQDFLPTEVAELLAKRKANAFRSELKSDELIITADTTVVMENKLLEKPADAAEAENMIKALSGKKHKVISGVCLLSLDKEISFSDTTEVYFNDLSDEEINYYIQKFKPFDKAGAYGIQEWIGMAGISKISGSFYNVVGLPVARLYQELKVF